MSEPQRPVLTAQAAGPSFRPDPLLMPWRLSTPPELPPGKEGALDLCVSRYYLSIPPET